MKNLKKYLAIIAGIAILGASTAVFALDVKSPAEILSNLTAKPVEEVAKERAAGKTYGSLAKDAGKLDAFKAQMLAQKKGILDQRVQDGKITQTKADEIYNTIKGNQESCDGTANTAFGKRSGVGFGQGNCLGSCQGKGMGLGRGQNGKIGIGYGFN